MRKLLGLAIGVTVLSAGCGQGGGTSGALPAQGGSVPVRVAENRTVSLDLRQSSPGYGGSQVWTGKLSGDPYSSAALVTLDGQTTGTVSGTLGNFRLDLVDGELVATPEDGGSCAGAVPGPPGEGGVRPKLGDATAQAATVDVYCLYTQNVLDLLGTTGNVTARAQSLVAFANTVYDNSEIDMTLRLAGVEKVDYTPLSVNNVEVGDLTAMRAGPEFQGVRDKRNAFGIDLYCLLVNLQVSGPFTSGIGYLPSKATGLRPDLCYSVVSLNGGGGTFAHELGHNFGCSHDKDASSPPLPPAEALYPFAYGFRKPGVWGTIMAYRQSGESRISYFSNPSVSFQGDVTGSAGTADNAQAMRLSMNAVANYATASGVPSPTPVPTPTPTPVPTPTVRPSPTPTPSPGNSVVVGLNAGWNAVGFQRQRITGISTPSVAGMAYFDGSAYQTRSATADTINGEGDGTRRGIWLYATASTLVTYNGDTDGFGNFVNLKSGYNFVCFNSATNVAGSALRATQDGQSVSLGSVVLPQFTEIQADNSYQTVDVQAGGQLKPGRAYFVFATGNVRLTW